MNDEQYLKIIEELTEELDRYSVGSEGYAKVFEMIERIEKLYQGHSSELREDWKVQVEFEKFERELSVKEKEMGLTERELKTRLILGGIAAGLTLFAMEYTTNWSYGNPITNKIASGVLGKLLGKV